MLALSLGLAPPVAAQGVATRDTLYLVDVVRLAQEANPALAAAKLRAQAARARVSPAGTLPDPVVGFAIVNRPLDTFGTDDEMTMNEFRVTQVVPVPGKLSARQREAAGLADAVQFEYWDAAWGLRARVIGAYLEVAYLDRALIIMEDTRAALRGFAAISLSRYEVGDGLQQDVLQAQVAVARVSEDIEFTRQERVATVARLNALLGRDASEPVAAVELPEQVVHIMPVDSLMAQAARTRPALAASQARVTAAEAGYEAARRELYPDLMVSAAYGQRPQFTDMATLMVGVSVPIWASRRQLAWRREGSALELEARANALEIRNQTFAGLAEARAEAERARRLRELYQSSVLPQSRAAVTASLAAYQTGRVNLLTLLDNQTVFNRYAIEALRLTAVYHRARAQIEALAGIEFLRPVEAP